MIRVTFALFFADDLHSRDLRPFGSTHCINGRAHSATAGQLADAIDERFGLGADDRICAERDQVLHRLAAANGVHGS